MYMVIQQCMRIVFVEGQEFNISGHLNVTSIINGSHHIIARIFNLTETDGRYSALLVLLQDGRSITITSGSTTFIIADGIRLMHEIKHLPTTGKELAQMIVTSRSSSNTMGII